MARYNPEKPKYYAAIRAALLPLAQAALAASRADQIAVDHAANAVAFAKNWTADTTELSRRVMASHTALLIDSAGKLAPTRLRAALLAYGAALEAFNASKYPVALRQVNATLQALEEA